MSSEENLNQLDESKRVSAIHRYAHLTGIDYEGLNRKEKNKLTRTQAYKQWKAIQRIKKRLQLRKAMEEAVFDPSQTMGSRYKHLDPHHIAQKAAFTSLLNKGYSTSQRPLKSLKSRGFKAKKPGMITFQKRAAKVGGGFKNVASKTFRKLTKQKEFHGKTAIMSDLEINYSKVNKLLEKSKEIKNREYKNCEKEIEIKKPMTGGSNTNVVQITPSITDTKLNF